MGLKFTMIISNSEAFTVGRLEDILSKYPRDATVIMSSHSGQWTINITWDEETMKVIVPGNGEEDG